MVTGRPWSGNDYTRGKSAIQTLLYTIQLLCRDIDVYIKYSSLHFRSWWQFQAEGSCKGNINERLCQFRVLCCKNDEIRTSVPQSGSRNTLTKHSSTYTADVNFTVSYDGVLSYLKTGQVRVLNRLSNWENTSLHPLCYGIRRAHNCFPPISVLALPVLNQWIYVYCLNLIAFVVDMVQKIIQNKVTCLSYSL